MTLHLKATNKAAKFEYADGRMTVSWDVDASLKDDELVEELRRIVAFYDAQADPAALPQRTAGQALAAAQEAFPAPEPVTGNGWATYRPGALPELPERLQGEVELIPPREA